MGDGWNPFGGVDRKAQDAPVASVPIRCRTCGREIPVGTRMALAVDAEERGSRHFGSPKIQSWQHLACASS